MGDDPFAQWLEPVPSTPSSLIVLTEQPGGRSRGIQVLKELLADHFVGEASILKVRDFKAAAAVILNSLPSSKRTRSGDLAELLATEYVNARTAFEVPIKKLRWKSDREMPMHGNDLIGIDASTRPPRVFKGECKSRASYSESVGLEAAETLDGNDGRPNPASLAFITKRLLEQNRDEEALVFVDLQTRRSISSKRITHGLFLLTGRDPVSPLSKLPPPKQNGIKREAVAIVVKDHQKFIETVFQLRG